MNNYSSADSGMENVSLNISQEVKTFVVPLSPEYRNLHWIDIQEKTDFNFRGIIVISQTEGSDIQNCEICFEILKEALNNKFFEESYFIFEESEELETKITEIFSEINRTLFSISKKEDRPKSVSLLTALIFRDILIIGNVGGSNIAIIRENKFNRISVLQCSPNIAAMGNEKMPPVDIYKVILKDNDSVLFYTDGISDTLMPEELIQFISNQADGTKSPLIEIITKATEKNPKKDLTAVLLKVKKNSEKKSLITEKTESEAFSQDSELVSPKEVLPEIQKKKSKLNQILILILSAVLTVVIGNAYLWNTYNYDSRHLKIILNSSIPLENANWLGKEFKMENFSKNLILPSGLNDGILTFETEKSNYEIEMSIISSKELTGEVLQSQERLTKNKVFIENSRFRIEINLFSRIDPYSPESKSIKCKDDTNEHFMTYFKLSNLIGPFELDLRKSDLIDEINIDIRKYK